MDLIIAAAEEEASAILRKARSDAHTVLSEAHLEAEKIRSSAHAEAEAIRQNALADAADVHRTSQIDADATRRAAELDAGLYEVEKIIGAKRNALGDMEYKVKWKYFPGEDSWVEKSNMMCNELIEAYENGFCHALRR
jgi:vacuolar-type H+-ATPase subunit H